MSTMVKILFFILLVIGGATYLFYEIYKNPIIFVLVPILSLSPIFFMVIMRKYDIDGIEFFLGHYMFYLNYVLVGSTFILGLALISKLFSINLLAEIGNRKNLFLTISVIVIGIIAFFGNRNFENVIVENYEHISTSPEEKRELKFSFISDVHLNGKFDGSKLRIAFEKMKKENVELVLIGGDFLDYSYTSITDDIKSIIDEYDFKYGIYLALGNHEYYGGVEENMEYIRGLGINILRDEKVEIEGITIIGRDDNHNKNRKSLEELTEGLKDEDTVIVIDHNPASIEEIGNKKVDFYLSGHTHRGQIFPFNLIVDQMYVNSRGYKKVGETHTYVSSGLGTWMIPYRIGSQSEILVIDLKM